MRWRLILSAYLVQLFSLTFVYHWAYIEHIEPENSETYRSLQYCGSPAWNLLHATLMALGIWRWLRDYGEIGGPMYCAIIRYSNQ